MPRILHAGDLHLGMENYGRLDPATGLSSRITDCLAALDETVEFALAHEVDLFLFCGDAYRTRDPSPTLQREFARRIARLASSGVAVFLLVGNHDLPNAMNRATAVEIFDTLAVRNVHVASKPHLHRVDTRGGPLQIVALPWILRSLLLSKEEFKNRTLEEVNAALADKVERLVRSLAEDLDPAVPAVLVAHGMVAGATVGSERSIMLGQDLLLNRSVLAHSCFDYVALGHVHKTQVLSSQPPMVYAGSLQRIDFSEEKEPKGFYVVDIGSSPDVTAGDVGFPVTFQFVPVTARPFVTIDVDADTDDPTATVLEALGRHQFADAVVRLRIKLSARREGLLQEGEIRRALKDAYFVAAITKDVQRENRTRWPGKTAAEMTPLEALQAYLETRHTPADRTEVLAQYARRLLEGAASS